MVLLKDYSDKGFKFFTNFNSRKGHEMAENPYASLCFYWESLSRQVRIEGKVEKISDAESEEYFSKRPFNSRISAYISAQSEIIRDKQVRYYFRKIIKTHLHNYSINFKSI
jgi:pyridoxamine 5'-phosphate oxidase